MEGGGVKVLIRCTLHAIYRGLFVELYEYGVQVYSLSSKYIHVYLIDASAGLFTFPISDQ